MALDMLVRAQLPHKWIRWHVGQDDPRATLNTLEISMVCADGDELEKIRAEISGIPMSTKRVVTWYGDDARFIVANLNY